MDINTAKETYYKASQDQKAAQAKITLQTTLAKLAKNMNASAANTPNLMYGPPSAIASLSPERQAQIKASIASYNTPTGDLAKAQAGDKGALGRLQLKTALWGAGALGGSWMIGPGMEALQSLGLAMPAIGSQLPTPKAPIPPSLDQLGSSSAPRTTQQPPSDAFKGNDYYSMISNALKQPSQPK